MLGPLSKISRISPSLVSNFLQRTCYNPHNPHRLYLSRLYDGLLEPCLNDKSHFVRTPSGRVKTVILPYHDYQRMQFSDYFTGLGYLLAHQGRTDSELTFVELLHILSNYAEWCRVSAGILGVNTPTVVQLLWVLSPSFRFPFALHDAKVEGRFSLASSVAAGKGDGREDVREERISSLEDVWRSPLPYPTPVQQEHANLGVRSNMASAELFGTPWGHCGETVTFASMYKMIYHGISLGTLALSVKSMTSLIPGTNLVPVEVIPNLEHLKDIIEILRISGAMRPMCLNCQYLRTASSGRIDDYAHRLSIGV